MRRLRILNDSGMGRGTEVIDEDGNVLPMVRSVNVHLGLDGPNTALVEVLMPRVDVVADATITGVCPYCGHREETT